MRILIVISADQYVRNLVTSGALAGIDGPDTFYVSSARGVRAPAALEALPGYEGSVEDPESRLRPYAHLQNLLLVALRGRSQTMAIKTRQLPLAQRVRYGLAGLPGVRKVLVERYLRRIGRNADLERTIDRLRPDLVVAPSGGVDALVLDAIGAARRRGVPSLVLVHNWDNLSSKGVFPVRPDVLAVWGEQSAEHAARIHRFERDRVAVLGAPSLDPYFRHEPGSSPSPFPFPYVLFAGCFAPFDELAALERLERLVEVSGLDLKVVYRPHPQRQPRERSDFVDERRFRHVVVDPQVRELYLAAFDAQGQGRRPEKPLFPPLDYYPALLEHARFVVCPLSTMIVEAAIFERRVLAIGYDDGIHAGSPSTVIDYDHFEGLERMSGIEVCRTPEALDQAVSGLLSDAQPGPPRPPLREQIRWWLYHDEHTYAERLAALVAAVGRERGLQPAAPGDVAPALARP